MNITDLNFSLRPNGHGGTQAKVTFNNGYGASVITGWGTYTTPDKPYEVAIMQDDVLCYDTPITDDVIGHCTASRVTELLNEIESLPTAV